MPVRDGAAAHDDRAIVLFGSEISRALAAQFDVRITEVKDPIPEPALMILMGTAFVGMGMIRRKRT